MTYFQVASGDTVGSAHMNAAINQGIPRFATAAERDAAIPAPTAGMHCFVNDLTVSVSGLTQRWNGAAWEVIAGDTGWCDISSYLANGWTGVGVVLVMRRVGASVRIRSGGITSPAVDGNTVPIPGNAAFVGFQTPHTTYESMYNASNGLNVLNLTVVCGGSTNLVSITGVGTIGTGSIIRFDANYLTSEPFPTILPGTQI